MTSEPIIVKRETTPPHVSSPLWTALEDVHTEWESNNSLDHVELAFHAVLSLLLEQREGLALALQHELKTDAKARLRDRLDYLSSLITRLTGD